MKTIVWAPVVFLVFAAAAPAKQVTVAQCRSVLSNLSKVRTEAEVKQLFATMTAGDELQLSTSLSSCVQQHSDVLAPAEIAMLNLFTYKLDANVIARMGAFLERHKLEDVFNDEEEAKRVK